MNDMLNNVFDAFFSTLFAFFFWSRIMLLSPKEPKRDQVQKCRCKNAAKFKYRRRRKNPKRNNPRATQMNNDAKLDDFLLFISQIEKKSDVDYPKTDEEKAFFIQRFEKVIELSPHLTMGAIAHHFTDRTLLMSPYEMGVFIVQNPLMVKPPASEKIEQLRLALFRHVEASDQKDPAGAYAKAALRMQEEDAEMQRHAEAQMLMASSVEEAYDQPLFFVGSFANPTDEEKLKIMQSLPINNPTPANADNDEGVKMANITKVLQNRFFGALLGGGLGPESDNAEHCMSLPINNPTPANADNDQGVKMANRIEYLEDQLAFAQMDLEQEKHKSRELQLQIKMLEITQAELRVAVDKNKKMETELQKLKKEPILKHALQAVKECFPEQLVVFPEPFKAKLKQVLSFDELGELHQILAEYREGVYTVFEVSVFKRAHELAKRDDYFQADD